MQGFKGLLPRQVLTDEAFQPVFKKAEDHRKAAQLCIDFFQQIHKFFESFSVAVEKCVQECDIENVRAPYYSLIGFVCTKMLLQNKQLTENTKQSSKQLTRSCNSILEDFSKYLMQFQTNLRKYQEHELIIQELCKKYYRSHKNMISSIDAYKNALTDVTLIYNEEEKIKRYMTCEANYKLVSSEFAAISEKCEVLTERKAKAITNFEEFKTEFTKVIKLIGTKVIEETKNLVGYYCVTNKTITTFLAEQKYNLQKQKLYPFFSDMENQDNLQIFEKDQIPQRNGKNTIPLIFECPHLIKDEYIETYNMEMLGYLKRVEDNTDKRRQENKRIYDLFFQYFKIIEKIHIMGVKEIIKNFKMLREKLIQSFGPRLPSFMKSINSIFELLSGINEKLIKSINLKLVEVSSFINEESKILKLFAEELKTNIEKFIGKKELKRIMDDDFSEEASVVNIVSFKKESSQKGLFLKHLILGFEEKMGKNSQKISKGYTNIVNDLSQSTNEFYSLCCQYQSLYFGVEEFEKNFKIYESDVDALIEKNKKNLEQLPFNVLKGDNSKIVFDGQFGKTEEFKKLKKPVSQEPQQPSAQKQIINSKQNIKQETKQKDKENIKEKQKEKDKEKSGEQPKSPKANNTSPAEEANNSSNRKQSLQILELSRKSSISLANVDEKEVKNYDFLITKIELKQNQQYIKSFSCALSSKIVLHGRMYITSERICFSSSFNANNLFFGGTFIQFPKQDITKIEKRQNSLLMDMSICISTVKGQLSFTSFFSRNQAYDLICKTFVLSLDEHIYEADEEAKEPEPVMPVEEIKEDDDIKEEELECRASKIDEICSQFKYVEAVTLELNKDGLTALQLFKTFYASNEVSINRRKYPNFLMYIKELIEHKDVEIDDWDVALTQILNQCNIKTSAPLKTVRKIRATVPVSNSGIPFLPKSAKSQEVQTLHFFSKHKWILDAEISTSGAPYTDTFKVQLRTLVSSEENGKCNVSIGFYVNFLKQTMMKAMIQSKSSEETVKASKVWTEQIKKYITNQQKAEQGKNTKQGEQVKQQVNKVKEELEERAKELEKLLMQKSEMKKQLESMKLEKQQSRKLIIGLVVLNAILILLLSR